MPFQPLTENEPSRPHSGDATLLAIRILLPLAFAYYQLVDQLDLARLYIWEKADWTLVDSLAELGTPVPGVLAVVSVLLLLVAFLGLAVGVFTRINALLLFVLIGAAFLFPLEISRTLSPQTFVLYLSVLLGILIGGGGRLTLDHHFSARREKKKS